MLLRSTRSPTTAPAGCWPASGRTTWAGSPGCGRPWRGPNDAASTRGLPGRHRRRSPGRGRRHRGVRPADRLPLLGGGLPQPATTGTTGRGGAGPRRGRPLHYLYAEASVETPGLPTPPASGPRPTATLASALVAPRAGRFATGPLGGHAPARNLAAPVAYSAGPHGASRRAGTATPSS